ncbi:MAG: hypothetical protein ACLVLG_06775, partial [Anaerovoracaceae bacterium]
SVKCGSMNTSLRRQASLSSCVHYTAAQSAKCGSMNTSLRRQALLSSCVHYNTYGKILVGF